MPRMDERLPGLRADGGESAGALLDGRHRLHADQGDVHAALEARHCEKREFHARRTVPPPLHAGTATRLCSHGWAMMGISPLLH